MLPQFLSEVCNIMLQCRNILNIPNSVLNTHTSTTRHLYRLQEMAALKKPHNHLC